MFTFNYRKTNIRQKANSEPDGNIMVNHDDNKYILIVLMLLNFSIKNFRELAFDGIL